MLLLNSSDVLQFYERNGNINAQGIQGAALYVVLLNPFRFYTTFCGLMAHKYKEVYAAAAEVLGLVLAFKDDRKDVSV